LLLIYKKWRFYDLITSIIAILGLISMMISYEITKNYSNADLNISAMQSKKFKN
jgi:hypothetical protein